MNAIRAEGAVIRLKKTIKKIVVFVIPITEIIQVMRYHDSKDKNAVMPNLFRRLSVQTIIAYKIKNFLDMHIYLSYYYQTIWLKNLLLTKRLT